MSEKADRAGETVSAVVAQYASYRQEVSTRTAAQQTLIGVAVTRSQPRQD
ncbi:MAG TPA: hypothetical protein VLA19_30955 [Herpetosiphonaceae bacterium]|nr:hypothetical protein [Herpetosiphonaceae bacterium]